MNTIRWNEVCIGCGHRLVNNEIYDGVCANCKSGSHKGITITPNKIKALTEEERKMLNIPSIDEFIQKMTDEMDFNYFKANKEHFVKLVEDLKAENKKLKEILKYSIVPKFKVGQEVFYIYKYKIRSYIIDHIEGRIFRYYDKDGKWLHEDDLFSSKEKAEEKLRESV